MTGSNIEIRLHRVTLTPDLKGTKTLPTVGLDDARFQYRPAIQTDLRQTFERARNALGVRKVERAA